MSQLKFDFEFIDTTILLSLANPGTVFTLKDGSIYMKVKPTGCLHNSKLLEDITDRGDCLAVQLKDGKLCYMRGDTRITQIEATLKGKLK